MEKKTVQLQDKKTIIKKYKNQEESKDQKQKQINLPPLTKTQA